MKGIQASFWVYEIMESILYLSGPAHKCLSVNGG